MPRGKINKSAKIRETFEALGRDARPKDVIAALAKRRIKVAPAAVSNIKAKLGNGATNGHRAAADNVSLATLISAKKFSEQLGGLAKAQSALSALAKLR